MVAAVTAILPVVVLAIWIGWYVATHPQNAKLENVWTIVIVLGVLLWGAGVGTITAYPTPDWWKSAIGFAVVDFAVVFVGAFIGAMCEDD